jgi:hypothetical protein
LTGKFDLTNVNNMAFYISGPKLLFETTKYAKSIVKTESSDNSHTYIIHVLTPVFLISKWPVVKAIAIPECGLPL